MDIDAFWKLIEEAGRGARPGPRDGYMDRFVATLEQLLRARSPEELVEFRDHLMDRMREAYNYDLWGAAYVIAQGCSDDGFHDFRLWLITMGREVYEQALTNPDSLVEPASRPEVESWFFEEMNVVPECVYEEMTGREMPDYPDPLDPLDDPPGTKFRDDRSDLPERYPALWAKFGQQRRQ